ncbi:DUF4255 domain-containing protein [Dyella tabacisoli]|uniref:DUF4255 domain-containing protein n=1 Tax=Dyella tabacisoli TaxID=2282381 RepID=A0A369UNZ1_9GAMM|nr:DUF4255 domain-containing protein [Dyella tabacisoli]RDD81340.1 DUF4255 domain-containing protein [Dyella tabacisoli]
MPTTSTSSALSGQGDDEPAAKKPADYDSSQVIRWVSESLRKLVREHIPLLSAESAVVFESPAEIEAVGENKLSLYLYQIEHNVWLRNLPPTLSHRQPVSAGPNTLQVTPAPLVVDLVYMMVPYAKSAELELVLADELLRLFHDVAALEGPLLHPGLQQTGNQCIDIVPRDSSIEALRELWAGFGGKPYKLTKLYLLSPVRIPSGRPFDTDMVTQTELSIVNTRPLPENFNPETPCTT